MGDPYRIKWLYSWNGLEHLREKLHQIAHQVVTTDCVVRSQYPWIVATGLICQAMRTPEKSISSEVLAAAEAQNELNKLQHELVWTYHLEFDFVRKEWASILDPQYNSM